MATIGYYANPSHKSCFRPCRACSRCDQKHCKAECNNCSGYHDPFGTIDPDERDYCRCTEGILQFIDTKKAFVQVRLRSNPYKGTVLQDLKTEDERDHEEYVRSIREKLDKPDWEPFAFTDGPGFKVIDPDQAPEI